MKTNKKAILLAFILLFIASLSHSQNNKSTLSTNSNEALSLSIDGNGYSDQTYVLFDSAATTSFDNQFDMYKLFGLAAAPQLYTIIDTNIKLSINTLPTFNSNVRVQMGFRVGYDTTYVLSASGFNTFPTGSYILLKDSMLNVITNLNQQASYTFAGHTTDSAKRFILYFVNTTSIKEEVKDNFKIYSDNNSIYIHNDNINNIKEIEIYNLLGQVVYNKKIDDTRAYYKVDMMNNAKNIYLVKIKTSDKIITRKVFLK